MVVLGGVTREPVIGFPPRLWVGGEWFPVVIA